MSAFKRLTKEFEKSNEKYKELGYFIHSHDFIKNSNNNFFDVSYILFENIIILFNNHYPFKSPKFFIKYNSYFVEINHAFYSLFKNYENKLKIFNLNDNLNSFIRGYNCEIDLKIKLQFENWSPGSRFFDYFNLIDILIKKTKNTKLILQNEIKEIKLKELFPLDSNEYNDDIIILMSK